MKKWLKRLTLFVVGLVLVLGVAAVCAYYFGVRRTPAWLERRAASAEDLAAAANRLDQKLLHALNYAGESSAYDGIDSKPPDPNDKRPAASQPAEKLKVEFTEDELNASFQKWDRLYGWTERYRDHVEDPAIVLHGGKIILAGKSEAFGTVISLHFDPKLVENGKLRLRLSSILAGRVPLHQMFFEKYRTSVRNRLTGALPNLQRKAEFKPDGSANTEAMSAAMAKLFLHVLADEPGEPVLFLPVKQSRSVPMRLTEVTVENKTLSMTVKPMNASERAALLKRIRGSPDTETALKPTATGIKAVGERGS